MKICVAQTRPVKADILVNIEAHKKMIDLAVSYDTEIIIFPELSITGYEPGLAKELATDRNDSRFDDFQKLSDANNITIGAGMPLKSNAGPMIGMIIFQPDQSRQVYAKQYLHEDELPYFTSGQEQVSVTINGTAISLAICYEISVPEHAENSHKNGAQIYLASVAKSVAGIEKALKNLSDIARNYSMTVLMSNCIGYCDNFQCGGKTSAWNNKGELIGQLDNTNEGILIVTDTQEVIRQNLP
jgi:predicted amidohydrolase